MKSVQLEELVGGALQEKFNNSFKRVIENMKDVNTSFKNKREIAIKLKFTQDEAREDVTVTIDVSEKLAPQRGLETKFMIGQDLKTGEVFAQEYGKQVPGQMSIDDFDEETGEIKEQTVIDIRAAK